MEAIYFVIIGLIIAVIIGWVVIFSFWEYSRKLRRDILHQKALVRVLRHRLGDKQDNSSLRTMKNPPPPPKQKDSFRRFLVDLECSLLSNEYKNLVNDIINRYDGIPEFCPECNKMLIELQTKHVCTHCDFNIKKINR